ncbi:MAG TPA: hypothetical protein VKS79_25405 [Gemmataceae bacterium]|nr:hypothetical protein [Gemmataceae bacterium]
MKRVCLSLTLIGMIGLTGCKKNAPSGSAATLPRTGNSDSAATASNRSLQAAYDNGSRATERVIQLLNNVKDDSSAQAAAGPLRSAAAELASALKQMKLTVAALDAAGRKQEIVQFHQKLAESGQEPALNRLQPAVERVVNSPQGRKLRSEINAVLDALLENVSVTEREHLQRWIQEKNLRQ